MKLPLTHVTTWEKLSAILADGYLKPKLCKFFKEQLVYLNYGRLAHKPSDKEENWFLNSPIVLFFKPAAIFDCFRFFPFDTGAIIGGRFKNTELNRINLLEDYCFNISKETQPEKWINKIYKNQSDYIELISPELTNVSSKTRYILLDMYDQVIKKKTNLDYRLTSIECQSKKAVFLNNAFAIAVPAELKKEIRTYIKNTNLQVFFYYDKSINGHLPNDLTNISLTIFNAFKQINLTQRVK